MNIKKADKEISPDVGSHHDVVMHSNAHLHSVRGALLGVFIISRKMGANSIRTEATKKD